MAGPSGYTSCLFCLANLERMSWPVLPGTLFCPMCGPDAPGTLLCGPGRIVVGYTCVVVNAWPGIKLYPHSTHKCTLPLYISLVLKDDGDPSAWLKPLWGTVIARDPKAQKSGVLEKPRLDIGRIACMKSTEHGHMLLHTP